MPFPPQQPTDPFATVNQALLRNGGRGSLPGFESTPLPSPNGFTTRTQFASERPAVSTRNLVQWFLPETGIVEMYVNPQSISYQFKKHIQNQRTKGGYVLQYWGEDLTQLSIQGTTGSSGVEGINVLLDVYRNEQIQFDPFALALASDRDTENNDQFSFLGDFPDDSLGSLLTGAGNSFTDLVSNSVETGATASTRAQPTLASLAFTVEMYYSGWVFRGYFTDFRVDERANNLGLFDYNMTFMVTQRRGVRPNFLGWHRAPNSASDTDSTAYSYNGLHAEQSPPRRQSVEEGASLTDTLKIGKSIVNSAFDSFTSIF